MKRKKNTFHVFKEVFSCRCKSNCIFNAWICVGRVLNMYCFLRYDGYKHPTLTIQLILALGVRFRFFWGLLRFTCRFGFTPSKSHKHAIQFWEIREKNLTKKIPFSMIALKLTLITSYFRCDNTLQCEYVAKKRHPSKTRKFYSQISKKIVIYSSEIVLFLCSLLIHSFTI